MWDLSGTQWVLAQAAGAGNAPTSSPNMVGLPEGSQPIPAPGTTGQPAGPVQTAPQSPFGGTQMMLILLVPFVLLILMQTLGGRKERKKRQEMLSSMKKNDRVITLGGIIGSITDMYEDEIVLKLEDGKMRVTRAAIQTVLKDPRARDEAPGASDIELKSGRSKATV